LLVVPEDVLSLSPQALANRRRHFHAEEAVVLVQGAVSLDERREAHPRDRLERLAFRLGIDDEELRRILCEEVERRLAADEGA
jgi:hypothetical protein